MNVGRRLGSHVRKFADRGGQLMQKAMSQFPFQFEQGMLEVRGRRVRRCCCARVAAFAQQPAPESVGGEANLKLPDLVVGNFL